MRWLNKSKKSVSVKFPSLKDLQQHVPQIGQLEWIGIRPSKRSSVLTPEVVHLDPVDGIAGDHYSRKGGNRQVTLIQKEHLQTIGSILKGQPVDPALTRRNLVISGINLLALLKRQIRIGDEVILEITGNCHPCSRMEENLGDGGYNAMRGLGGVTARIIRGGELNLNDQVFAIEVV